VAAPALVNHAFVSAKPDSPDGTIVSSSEWNNVLLLTGGSQGQALLRDAGSVTGASWIDGPNIQVNSGTYNGSSPSPDLAQILVTNNTAAYTMAFATIAAVTSGGANVNAFIKRNGVATTNWIANGLGQHSTMLIAIGEFNPGTVTWTVAVATIAGSFTSLTVQLMTLRLGIA
jgi:hypothetical protein